MESTELIRGNHHGEKALAALLLIEDAYQFETRQMAKFLQKRALPLAPLSLSLWIKELDRRLRTGEMHVKNYNKHLSMTKNRLRWFFEKAEKRFDLDPAAVRGFKEYLADLKPIKLAKHETQVGREKVRTPAEILELQQAADPKTALWIEFMASTGVRVSEMISASVAKVLEIDCTVEIIGKGKKLRNVWIERDLYGRIVKVFGESAGLLFTHSGKPYTRIYVTHQIKALSTKLWGPERAISAHKLRHSFVSEALRQGKPLEQVSAYVGHATTDITARIYGHNPIDRGTFRGLMK